MLPKIEMADFRLAGSILSGPGRSDLMAAFADSSKRVRFKIESISERGTIVLSVNGLYHPPGEASVWQVQGLLAELELGNERVQDPRIKVILDYPFKGKTGRAYLSVPPLADAAQVVEVITSISAREGWRQYRRRLFDGRVLCGYTDGYPALATITLGDEPTEREMVEKVDLLLRAGEPFHMRVSSALPLVWRIESQ